VKNLSSFFTNEEEFTLIFIVLFLLCTCAALIFGFIYETRAYYGFYCSCNKGLSKLEQINDYRKKYRTVDKAFRAEMRDEQPAYWLNVRQGKVADLVFWICLCTTYLIGILAGA